MYTRQKESGERGIAVLRIRRICSFVRSFVRTIVQSNHPSNSGCCSEVRVGCVHHVSRNWGLV